jgi:hypothetical protein
VTGKPTSHRYSYDKAYIVARASFGGHVRSPSAFVRRLQKWGRIFFAGIPASKINALPHFQQQYLFTNKERILIGHLRQDTTMNDIWTLEKMYELGTRHARIEAEKDLDALMATMIEEPVYEFYPIGKTLRGAENVRRYYRQFMDVFMNTIVDYRLVEEWCNTTSVCQEYDIVVEIDGVRETHRTLGILYATGELLGGERIYGSERMIRQFAGDMYDALEPL